MATKRSAPEIHPSRRDIVPAEPRKRRKINPHPKSGKSFKKAHPVNDLKSRVRSLRRLLEHSDDMPANIRVEKERALQSAQYELDQAQRAKTRSDMIGRWHRVRFFERQKATKRLKRAKKALTVCEDTNEKKELARAVQEADVDLHYAMFYPLDVDYVPLFPARRKQSGDEEEDSEQAEGRNDSTRQGDQAMWLKVQQCMEAGTLEALRNGKLEQDRGASKESISSRSRAPAEKSIHKAKSEKSRESDEESDGGFFE